VSGVAAVNQLAHLFDVAMTRLEQVDALHQPVPALGGRVQACSAGCGQWPCVTRRVLHPELKYADAGITPPPGT